MHSNNKGLATVDYLKSDNSWEALLSVAEDSRFEMMLWSWKCSAKAGTQNQDDKILYSVSGISVQ